MSIYKNSRYEGSYTYSDYDNPETVYLDPVREAKMEPEIDDLQIEFQQGDRLDIIAFKLYGDAKLDWIILDANPQYLSGFDIQSGDIIRCPLPEKVSEMLV